MGVSVDYCGELVELNPESSLTIGREGELRIDDNPFLHRHFLTISAQNAVWLISNVGTQLSATVSDDAGRLEAFLAPGATLPLVFERTRVAFTAGPTSYEFSINNDDGAFRAPNSAESEVGDTTIGPTKLTRDQLLMIVALAEPRLKVDGRSSSALPSSNDAAMRLGWTITKFNRKLDNVCEKLTRLGVRGLHGNTSDLATNRRARLVEYSIATGLVVREQVDLLGHG